jgi:hypothetical protein
MKKTIPFLLISIFLTNCAARLTTDKKNYLKNELEGMVKFDQIAAYIPQGKYKEYTQEQWQEFKDSVFTNNKIMVEKIFHKYGFLGFNKVGKDGSHNFWLIIQHCGKYPEFQKKMLKSMDKEVKKGNANPNDFAYLYDRVKVNAGEKQLFGTQVIYETKTTGRAVPKVGLVDSANVDRLRKKYNLEPLKEYLNSMTTNHYEMNKEHYFKMGIVKPNLY